VGFWNRRSWLQSAVALTVVIAASDGGVSGHQRVFSARGTKVMKRICLMLAVFAIAGCGESEEDKRTEERYREALQDYKAELKEWKEDQVAYDECVESMDAFRSKVKELDGRLSVGLDFGDYSQQVGDAAAAYSQSDFEGGGVDCLTTVGLPLENALRQYQKSYNVWQECFEDYTCEVDSIESTLRQHWDMASTNIIKSDSALDRLKVGPRPEPPPKPDGV
jgi:hypothetical protein